MQIAGRVLLTRELITTKANDVQRPRSRYDDVTITAFFHCLPPRARICLERKKCCTNMRHIQKHASNQSLVCKLSLNVVVNLRSGVIIIIF